MLGKDEEHDEVTCAKENEAAGNPPNTKTPVFAENLLRFVLAQRNAILG